jgi:hypothetical protein
MKLRWSVRPGVRPGVLPGVLATALLLLAAATAEPVAAQGFDPASTVRAYTAALNNHDVAAALALFDRYGSATNAAGRTFDGPDGLRQFLLDSGFGNPDARITTDHLRVVGNRALWTYTCSCDDRPTEVRLVVNQDKITVFFMSPQSAASLAAARTRLAARSNGWPLPTAALLGGLVLVLAIVVLGLRRRRPPGGRVRAASWPAWPRHVA